MKASDYLIGIAADLSKAGVKLVYDILHSGHDFALIPIGEPAHIIDQWLAEIGVEIVIYSAPLPNILALSTKTYATCEFKFRGINPKAKTIIRTSGSTAKPKSVVLSVAAHLASARAVCDYFGLNKSSMFGLSLPLHHVSGLSILFRSLVSGCGINILPEDYQDITHISLVPAQLYKNFEQKQDLSKLSAVIMGGDAVPDRLVKQALEQNISLFHTYGMTEMASMIYVYDHKQDRGQVLSHAQINISPNHEIIVSGESLCDGHTSLLTGDLGCFTGNNYLEIIGRTHNMIISGGENIQPEEIERILNQHPQVLQSLVIGVSDLKFGQVLKAFVKYKHTACTASDLTNFLFTKLHKYKIPKYFEPWPDAMPLMPKHARVWVKKNLSLTSLS